MKKYYTLQYFRLLKNIIIILAVLFLSTLAPSSDRAYTLEQDNVRLIAKVTDPDGTSYLAQINPENIEILAEIDVRSDFGFLSPDRRMVAFISADNYVSVFDNRGQRIHRYSLSDSLLTNEHSLHLWGWQSNETIILSVSNREEDQFYRLHLSNSPPTLELWEKLYQIFPIGLYQLANREDTIPEWVYRFNPSFDFFVSPIPQNGSFEDWDEESAYVYNLETGEQLNRLTSLLPWYYHPFTSLSLSWANNTPSFVFATLESAEQCAPELYVFTIPVSIEHVAAIACENNQPSLIPTYMAWSPDDSQIAYWVSPLFPNDENEFLLTLLHVERQQPEVLYHSTAPLSHAGLQWSPDGTMIAFTTNVMSTRSQVMVITVENWREAASWTASFDYTVGWLGWMLSD